MRELTFTSHGKSATIGENFLNIVTSFKFPGSYENLIGLGIENDS